MMNGETITFAHLRRKLEELGFVPYRVSGDGRKGYMFERTEAPTARLYLVDYEEDDLVEPFELRGVWMTLKSRGIIEETNPLLF